MDHNRRLLAARYLRGSGIEAGALAGALRVPPGVTVRYVDRLPVDGLRDQYGMHAEKSRFLHPDIVDDAQTFSTISDESQDFVIVNHVVEHLEDPILFFENARRILKAGGVLYMTLPDKTHTFDHRRPVTPFEHLLEDHERGPEGSREAHFREFVRLAEVGGDVGAWRTEEEYEAAVQRLMEMDYSIHFHVWDRPAMIDMMLRVRADAGIGLDLETVVSTGNEVVLISRTA